MKTCLTILALLTVAFSSLAQSPPNIVWIVGEDASDHLGCYGERAIETPVLDRMAGQGVRFTNAIVTCPVCSPSRSAMVTGMFQTTLGAHLHRSQRKSGKGGTSPAYFDSYRLPVKSIPQLFQEAGYFVTNGADGTSRKGGKTDYNFEMGDWNYDGVTWRDRPEDQPFFAQFQLRGGKKRNKKQTAVDPGKIKLPPYYPDDPLLRDDWATYLNSWIDQDEQVGEILDGLQQDGLLDNTVVFFWTDHGVSHARGKQFLYDEGIRVPLIVRFPDARQAGSIRKDLVQHIDVAATSLALAGIPIPEYVQGIDLFAPQYEPRKYSFSARDRCDETVEIQRCVRTERYKYIRNFMSYLPHLQANQYKDGKAIIKRLRELNAEGKLTPLQDRIFAVPRPTEELYDLQEDPHETRNLALEPDFREGVKHFRSILYEWMETSRDPGLIPEPILEELGRSHGSKYHVLQAAENQTLVADLIKMIEAGESGDRKILVEGLQSDRPSIRYWAATWLGVNGGSAKQLTPFLKDQSPTVRIAAALAICRTGSNSPEPVALLAREVENPNRVAGMFAIRGLEMSGDRGPVTVQAAITACQSPYEFTRRIGRRLLRQTKTAP